MGYTTEFSGSFQIDPPLSRELARTLNAFCDQRHGGDIYTFEGCPSLWCDWAFSKDGTSMYWNGSEKSYEMTKWARYLKHKFFPTHKVTGRIKARGEDFDDIWEMIANDNGIYDQDGWGAG